MKKMRRPYYNNLVRLYHYDGYDNSEYDDGDDDDSDDDHYDS